MIRRKVIQFFVCILCIIEIASPVDSKAQQISDSSVVSQHLSLQEALHQLETQYKIRIFYLEDDLPDLKIDRILGNTYPESDLQKVIEQTNLGFLKYRDRSYILMPVQQLNQVFSASYYQALQDSRKLASTVATDQEDLVAGDSRSLSPSGQARVSGTVLQEEDSEPIIGATVAFTNLETGTITDEDGAFSLEVPVGTHDILVKYVGFDDLFTKIHVYGDGVVSLNLRDEAIDLEAVTVRAQAADAGVERVQIGVTTVDIKNIRKVPAFLGEADLVKTLLLNPGVSSLGEGSTGFNVRGGNVDQNLVQQDEGFFFNSSHALGFFSTFNADLLSSVELFKGNMPAQYGGRLASALDVETRNGDFESFKLKGGIGPVTSRMSLEGPLVRDKISFIAGVRSSYSDWILQQVKILEVQKSSAFFYDANLRLAIRPTAKSTIVISAYSSEDEFSYNEEFGFDYGTLMGQVIYRQIFNDRSFNKLSFVASRYESSQTDFEGINAAVVSNNVNYFKINELFTHTPNTTLKFETGVTSTLYMVEPGTQIPFGEDSDINPSETENEQGLESAIFGNVEYKISPALLISAGIRGVLYQYLGAGTVYNYSDPRSPTAQTITGTTAYDRGKSIANYQSLEPRFSMRYRLTEESSVKLGYSRTAQFINQIFNTDSPTPSSQWQLSTNYLDPFRSHNLSLGYFRNLANNLWETSFEIYGRYIDHLFDYRDFAVLVVNDHIETELLSGIGRTYGAELSIKKKSGILNGWLSYTYAKSERKIDGINSSNWYPSNFDKPHDASLILNYQPNRRNTLTINFSYSTGRPTTPPIGNYKIQSGLVIPIYSARNQYRIPDYHRLDVAYTLGKGYKRDKKIQTSWTISVYNLYARRNAFSVFFTQGTFSRRAQANQLSILGSAIPSLTFNMEIL